jgi:uncharacterized heparinase superfamily protein
MEPVIRRSAKAGKGRIILVASVLAWMGERLIALRLAVAASYRRIRAWPVSAGMMRMWIGRTPAPGLVLVPQELRTADPVRADEIMAGVNIFAGRIVTAPDPFVLPPPTDEWAEALSGFAWLRHLRAAGTPEAGETARRLVTAWMEAQGRADPVSWKPTVTAERIRAWLSASGLILAGADPAFYRRFSRSLWRQVRVLEAQYASVAPGAERLSVLIALVTAGLCIGGEDKLIRWSAKRLGDELDRQILPDGGHLCRDPGVLVGLVLDLLPLRQLFPARNVTPPAAILTAVDRMMPMIRFFQLGDGGLARFNGMGPTGIDQVATALVYDDTRGVASPSASHSGYERMEAGATVVLVEAGAPPPAAYSHAAHAGCLSLEFSTGRQIVVMNCGVPAVHRAMWRNEARKTAAHSTVTVADRSSARFAKGGPAAGLMLSGPRHVRVERHGLDLTASHDGYQHRLGVKHARRLALSEAGDRLDGEDEIDGTDRAYALRFHLHPTVQPIPTENPRSVLLRFASGEGWQFAADQAVLIEESVALAMPEGPRRSLQLVLQVASSTETPRIAWTFRRLERPTVQADREAAPELPL